MRRLAPPGGSDQSVQGTNDDAQISKLSCVQLGYFKDDFIKYFVTKRSRRSPLINRGYYSRAAALQELVVQFLGVRSDGKGVTEPAVKKQIDFPVVTKTKASIVSQTPAMLSLAGADPAVDTETGSIVSDSYCLMPGDLRDIGAFEAALRDNGFDPSVPTLVLSECVLVYMEPKYSQELVNWAGRTLPDAVFVVYEQIHPDDAFGQQMLINLESRGCPLKGIEATPTLEAHRQRFLRAGWGPRRADLRRIERLEIFDEFEEWHMIQEHYCITCGINDAQGLFRDFGFKRAAAAPPPSGALPAGCLPNAD
eukprot:jgi/Tetstr1/420591/TSEL_011679.t1